MRKRAQDRRHALAALLLSLVFHAGGAFLLMRYAVVPKPAVRQPIEVELRLMPRETPKPVQVPVPSQQVAKGTQKTKTRSNSPHPAEASPPSALSRQERGSSGEPTHHADEPRAAGSGVSLQPRVSTVLPGIGNGEGDDAQGHTVVNGPGEDGDPLVIAEYTREKVARKAQNIVDGVMGDVQRDSGTLPPYFSKVQGGMMDGFGKLAPELSEKTKKEKTQDVVDTWLLPASNYGKTGSPFANPDDERAVTETGLGRIANTGGFNHGDPAEAGRMNQTMQQLASMQVMVNAAQRPRLKTVLEVRQTSSGALAETVVLQKSGDDKFDEFVIHQTRKLISELGETEDGDTPWHDESSKGFRSVWQFTWEPPRVKVKLIRVMRAEAKVE